MLHYPAMPTTATTIYCYFSFSDMRRQHQLVTFPSPVLWNFYPLFCETFTLCNPAYNDLGIVVIISSYFLTLFFQMIYKLKLCPIPLTIVRINQLLTRPLKNVTIPDVLISSMWYMIVEGTPIKHIVHSEIYLNC